MGEVRKGMMERERENSNRGERGRTIPPLISYGENIFCAWVVMSEGVVCTVQYI